MSEPRSQLINYAGVNICLITVATHTLSSAFTSVWGGGVAHMVSSLAARANPTYVPLKGRFSYVTHEKHLFAVTKGTNNRDGGIIQRAGTKDGGNKILWFRRGDLTNLLCISSLSFNPFGFNLSGSAAVSQSPRPDPPSTPTRGSDALLLPSPSLLYLISRCE